MGEKTKNKARIGLPIIFAIIPVVLYIVEISMIVISAILSFGGSSFFPALLSVLGVFFVPITSFIFEIIGFIVAIRRKLKPFIIIYIIEIVLTILSCFIFATIFDYLFILF